MKLKNVGILFIISSPSGGGKTSITNQLIKNDNNLIRSVSATTRKPRNHETDGIDYFFKSKKDFLVLKEKDLLLEHAKVFDNYYGTIKSDIERNLCSGKDVLCCIDWQGAIQIQKKMQSVSIFLLPPSIQELQNRLLKRDKDSIKIINFRINEAKGEIVNYHNYDYLIINDSFDETLKKMHSIICAERNKIKVQDKAKEFINTLIHEPINNIDNDMLR